MSVTVAIDPCGMVTPFPASAGFSTIPRYCLPAGSLLESTASRILTASVVPTAGRFCACPAAAPCPGPLPAPALELGPAPPIALEAGAEAAVGAEAAGSDAPFPAAGAPL